MNIGVGDKVKSKPEAFTKVTGYVTAIHAPRQGQACSYVAVYCGKYESVLIPIVDVQKV